VTRDDLLYRFRLRTFAMAAELGNVRAACRAMGIHPSTYYRWKRQLTAMVRRSCGAGAKGAAANATSPLVEQRVVAFALGHPGFGPARAFARYLIPKQTGLRLDLERYLHYYNTERAHTGRWTKGRTPQAVLGKAKLWQKKR
jgi:hypothetical protein